MNNNVNIQYAGYLIGYLSERVFQTPSRNTHKGLSITGLDDGANTQLISPSRPLPCTCAISQLFN